MESNISTSKHAGGKNAGWMMLCLAAGVLAIVIWPVYLLLPALWAMAMFRTRPQWLALPAAVSLLAAYWLFGDWLAACCFTALAALPALALWLLQKRRVNHVYTAAILAALAVLALYGMVCLPGVLSGEGAFTAVQNMFSEAFAASRALVAATPGVSETLAETWSQYLDIFEDAVPSLIVPTLCALACALALSNLLFFRLFARGRDYGLARMRPFYQWSIPASMTTGLLLFLVASIAVSCAGWEYADGLSGTINVIVGFPLIVQGLSTLDSLMRRARHNVTLIRTFSYIAIGLLFPLLRSALMMLGCFEQIFHLRERLRAAQAQRPPR